MSYDSLSQEQQNEYREVFDHFDVTKKGSLDSKEVMVLFRALGEDVNESQASNLCGGGSMSFQAFLSNRAEKWAKMQAGNILKHAFKILDRNGQGYVDAEDLRRLLPYVGERLTSGEVEELIRDAGGGQQINYHEFVDKMMRKKN